MTTSKTTMKSNQIFTRFSLLCNAPCFLPLLALEAVGFVFVICLRSSCVQTKAARSVKSGLLDSATFSVDGKFYGLHRFCSITHNAVEPGAAAFFRVDCQRGGCIQIHNGNTLPPCYICGRHIGIALPPVSIGSCAAFREHIDLHQIAVGNSGMGHGQRLCCLDDNASRITDDGLTGRIGDDTAPVV